MRHNNFLQIPESHMEKEELDIPWHSLRNCTHQLEIAVNWIYFQCVEEESIQTSSNGMSLWEDTDFKSWSRSWMNTYQNYYTGHFCTEWEIEPMNSKVSPISQIKFYVCILMKKKKGKR